VLERTLLVGQEHDDVHAREALRIRPHREQAGAGSLRAKIVATPESGRERKVPTALAQTALVTDVADTLCRVRPDLRGRELSGSVS